MGSENGFAAYLPSFSLTSGITGLTNTKDGTVLSSYGYTYYAGGNQRTKTDHTGKTTTYAYDGLGRLTGEGDGTTSVSYAYDANSNRTQMIAAGPTAVTTSYTYNALNQLLTESRGSHSDLSVGCQPRLPRERQ